MLKKYKLGYLLKNFAKTKSRMKLRIIFTTSHQKNSKKKRTILTMLMISIHTHLHALAGLFSEIRRLKMSYEEVLRTKIECLHRVLSNLETYGCDEKAKAVVKGMIEGLEKALEVLA
jgi:hypothetical protein